MCEQRNEMDLMMLAQVKDQDNISIFCVELLEKISTNVNFA